MRHLRRSRRVAKLPAAWRPTSLHPGGRCVPSGSRRPLSPMEATGLTFGGSGAAMNIEVGIAVVSALLAHGVGPGHTPTAHARSITMDLAADTDGMTSNVGEHRRFAGKALAVVVAILMVCGLGL